MKRDYFGLFFISHIRLISVCKRRNNHCTSVIWLHSSFWFCFFDVALVIWQLHHTTANEINKWLTKFGRRASNDFNWLKNAGRNVEQLIGERCNILNIWKINHLSCAGLGRCETVLFSDAMHYMPQSFLSGWDYKPYYPVFLKKDWYYLETGLCIGPKTFWHWTVGHWIILPWRTPKWQNWPQTSQNGPKWSWNDLSVIKLISETETGLPQFYI